MSRSIGIINERLAKPGYVAGDFIVNASTAGVELHSEKQVTLSPEKAREYAKLLNQAACAAELMRPTKVENVRKEAAVIVKVVMTAKDRVRIFDREHRFEYEGGINADMIETMTGRTVAYFEASFGKDGLEIGREVPETEF